MIEAPPNLREPKGWKTDAIDYAVERLGITSFADLGGVGLVYGQYAYHAMDRDKVAAGAIVDDHPGLNNAWMASECDRRGIRRIAANFADPAVAERVGQVDAVMLFEVLLHSVAPDWDEIIRLWAPYTRCFIVANPQWDGPETVRLIDLGRDEYLRVVPPSENHAALFDRLDETVPRVGRPWRDAHFVWQWGITDRSLIEAMTSSGFSQREAEDLGPFGWGAEGFSNKSFVFTR